MSWHHYEPVLVFVVGAAASTLSGMAGGGGSFIITPFLILIGLTPQQAVATGKFGSFGLSAGAVAAFRSRFLENKKFSLFIITLSTLCGLVASLLLRSINNRSLQLVMGILMLAMLPFMVMKNRGLSRLGVSSVGKSAGTVLLTAVLLLQGILSGGIGSLVSAIFIIFFGLSALEANVMKRKSSIVLNTVVVVALFGSGLINFSYGFAGMAGGLIGGYAGSRIAIKKGENFARYALMLFMSVSGVWLIVSS